MVSVELELVIVTVIVVVPGGKVTVEVTVATQEVSLAGTRAAG